LETSHISNLGCLTEEPAIRLQRSIDLGGALSPELRVS
jgi:hypothetical protein